MSFVPVLFSQEISRGNDVANVSIDTEAAPELYPYYIDDQNSTVGKIFFLDKMDVVFKVFIYSGMNGVAVSFNPDEISQKTKITILPHQITSEYPLYQTPTKCIAKALTIMPAEGVTVEDGKVFLDKPHLGVNIRFQIIPLEGKFHTGTFKLNFEMPIEYQGKILPLMLSEPIVFRIRESIQVDEEKIIYNDYLCDKSFNSIDEMFACKDIQEKLLRENLAIDSKDGYSLARLADVLIYKGDFEEAGKISQQIVELLNAGTIHRLMGWKDIEPGSGKVELQLFFKQQAEMLKNKTHPLIEYVNEYYASKTNGTENLPKNHKVVQQTAPTVSPERPQKNELPVNSSQQSVESNNRTVFIIGICIGAGIILLIVFLRLKRKRS